MNKKNILSPTVIVVLLILVVTVISGGIGYKLGKKTSFPRSKELMMASGGRGQIQNKNEPNAGTGAGKMQGVEKRHTEGDILSINENTVTIKTADGSNKIVLLLDKTVYSLSSALDKENISIGQKVNIVGDINADGSISASELRLIENN
jgi:hypothetical protein